MALLLQNEQKQHLKLLDSQSSEVVKNVLENISSRKLLTNGQDNTDEKSLMTQAVTKLLIDTRKLQLTEKDFADQVKSQTGLKDEIVESFWNFLSNEQSFDDLITSDEYRFRDLEWRLEAKVASRYLHSHPPEPKILMKFHLDRENSLKHRETLSDQSEGSSKKEVVVETDANSLVHLIEQLEAAKNAFNFKRTGNLPS